jgi:hypothetical protein
MKVEQKTYAQIVIVETEDFIFSKVYRDYEAMCPFLCFPGMFAGDFRSSLRRAEEVMRDKDVILLLAPYWALLSTEEKKAVLDHELGHIASGHLKKTEEYVRRNGVPPPNKGPNLKEESEADAYSVNLNGNKAMHHGLMKAVDVMLGAYRKKGYNIGIQQVIDNDPILKKRLEILSQEQPQ